MIIKTILILHFCFLSVNFCLTVLRWLYKRFPNFFQMQKKIYIFNPLNAKLNHICHLLTLLGARQILHVSRMRVNNFFPAYNTFHNWHKSSCRQNPSNTRLWQLRCSKTCLRYRLTYISHITTRTDEKKTVTHFIRNSKTFSNYNS